MPRRPPWRMMPAVGMAVAIVSLSVPSAGAAGTRTVQCEGAGAFCGASVSIAKGAHDRKVNVELPNRHLKLSDVTVRPRASSRAFEITKGSYRHRGSRYRFTLNARRANPPGARIILTFARGGKIDGADSGPRSGTESAKAIFSIGSGKTVSIVGGGGGTSLCTRDETNTTFVTAGDNESHDFSFFAKDDGSCYWDLSWSQFKVRVKDSAETLVGSGTMFLGQQTVFGDYVVSCGYGAWVGVTCTKNNDRELAITP